MHSLRLLPGRPRLARGSESASSLARPSRLSLPLPATPGPFPLGREAREPEGVCAQRAERPRPEEWSVGPRGRAAGRLLGGHRRLQVPSAGVGGSGGPARMSDSAPEASAGRGKGRAGLAQRASRPFGAEPSPRLPPRTFCYHNERGGGRGRTRDPRPDPPPRRLRPAPGSSRPAPAGALGPT